MIPLAWVAILAAATPATTQLPPTVQTRPALPIAAKVKMSVWLVFDGGQSLTAFRAHAASIDTVSAEWFACGPDGHVIRRPNPTPDERQALFAIARPNRVRVLGLVANNASGGFAAQSVEKVLATDSTMRRHADELVAAATKEGLDGLDLDYELLMAKDRLPFSQFVSILADDCHRHHLFLAVAVHPKDSEPGTWDGAQAQDYAAIGRAADLVRVMTYDQHWETSEAGPVSAPDWTESIAKFAISVIPPQKVDLGVPGYGYDWVGKKGHDVTWRDFLDLAHGHGTPKRDIASRELTLEYQDHTVFFPDSVASSSKLSLARRLSVHGLALWRIGIEDPDIWNLYSGAASTTTGG